MIKVCYQEEVVVQLVKNVRKEACTNKWGARKLFKIIGPDLKLHSIKLGRDKFFDILRSNNMLVQKRKRKFFTTQSHHWLRKYENLIENLVIERKNQLWVSDITYIKSGDVVKYLYLITDAYSQKIVGWNLSEDLKANSALKALKRALSTNKSIVPNSLIHHSDRGIQYCSTEYTELLTQKGILISMTKPGSPQENAIAERINGILKEEWLEVKEGEQQKNTERYVGRIIKIYNQKRPHNSLCNMTPEEVHDKGFLRHKPERVIGKEYKYRKKAAQKNEQPSKSNNAIGSNDYSLSSCSSAELDSALSWRCNVNIF